MPRFRGTGRGERVALGGLIHRSRGKKAVPAISLMLSLQQPPQPLLGGATLERAWVQCVRHVILGTAVTGAGWSEHLFLIVSSVPAPAFCLLPSAAELLVYQS